MKPLGAAGAEGDAGGSGVQVAVIGAGKMGLPLACRLAERGARVVACDLRADLVDSLNRGLCPLDEPGVPALLAQVVREGRLRATTDTRSGVSTCEVVIVIVPVLLGPGLHADTSAIESATRDVAAGMQPGALVAYETTLPVGGARRLVPLLEAGGRVAGRDFDLVFSPERVKSGSVLQRLHENPKVVGGLTPRAAQRAAEFYGRFLGAPVIDVGTLEAAELVKLAGMVYRDVNIALTNELARYAEAVGVDYPSVLAAANTDGEAALLTPGIGVGGHCTPVYPHFLIQDAAQRGSRVELAALARRINAAQPSVVLERIEGAWGPLRQRSVTILGLAFRPQVKEHSLSPAFALRDELVRRGAKVTLHDPLYADEEIRHHGFEPARLEDGPCADVLVLATAHDAYRELDFQALAARGLRAVLDGRDLWDPARVRAAGLEHLAVGRPAARPR